MEVIQLKKKQLELQRLDKLIYEKIPSGFKVRESLHKYSNDINLEELRCKKEAKVNIPRAMKSLGSLGGGNHFIGATRF